MAQPVNKRAVMNNNAQAMSELCMLLQYRQLTSDTFARWVNRYFGDPGALGSMALVEWLSKRLPPHPVDRLRVIEFDMFLMGPEIQDCEFTRAMIELRNVFARSANMAIPATVTLEPAAVDLAPAEPAPLPPAPPPVTLGADASEVLARLLCAQGRGEATQELSTAFEAYALTARGYG